MEARIVIMIMICVVHFASDEFSEKCVRILSERKLLFDRGRLVRLLCGSRTAAREAHLSIRIEQTHRHDRSSGGYLKIRFGASGADVVVYY